MPTNLPTIGTIKYDTYTFGVMTETESIKGEAVWDRTGRSIMYMKWTITVKTRIAAAPPATIQATMESLRVILMAVGKPFRYEDKGFGDLIVNVGAVKDVAWGPTPKSFHWTPVGNDQAADLTWVVEVHVPECDNARYTGIMAATFGVTFEINENGLTKRNYHGEVTIATTRDGKRLVDNADAYREKIVPALPKYFRRTNQTYTVSEDKSRLEVRITDEEFPVDNFPPPGCSNVQLSHRYSCNGGKDAKDFFTRHMSTITATYTVVRGFRSEIVAFEHFKDIVEDRVLKKMRQAQAANAAGEAELLIVPTGSSMELLNVYDVDKLKISLSYAVTTKATTFMAIGMWEPVRGSDHDLWRKSMDKTFAPRGHAGLKFDNDDEVLIDLCLGQQNPPIGRLNNQPAKPKPPNINRLGKELQWPYPDKERSFYDYSTTITVVPTDNVMRHIPLESGESRLRTPALLNDRDSYARLAAISKGSDPPIFQARAASYPTLIFEGYAVRAGHRIPCPVLRAAYGYHLVPANEEGFGFQEIDLPFSGPIPFFLAKWRLRYMMSDRPVSLDGAANGNNDNRQQVNPPVRPVFNPNGGGGFGFGGGGPQAPNGNGIFGNGPVNFVIGGDGEVSPHTFS